MGEFRDTMHVVAGCGRNNGSDEHRSLGMNRVRATWYRLAMVAGMIAAIAIAAGAGNQW